MQHDFRGRNLAHDLAEALEGGKLALADVAGTLALRHSHLEHGVVVLADSAEQAAASFRSFERKEPRAGVISGRTASIRVSSMRVVSRVELRSPTSRSWEGSSKGFIP